MVRHDSRERFLGSYTEEELDSPDVYVSQMKRSLVPPEIGFETI
jgi:hypothetical protein